MLCRTRNFARVQLVEPAKGRNNRRHLRALSGDVHKTSSRITQCADGAVKGRLMWRSYPVVTQ